VAAGHNVKIDVFEDLMSRDADGETVCVDSDSRGGWRRQRRLGSRVMLFDLRSVQGLEDSQDRAAVRRVLPPTPARSRGSAR
jgi:hypothetical protein